MARIRRPDAGERAVVHVYTSLKIDEEWSVREGRGFTWWGKDFAQRVWAEPPVRDQGLDVSRLTAVTTIVAGVTPSARLDKLLTGLNGLTANLSAFVLDRKRKEVSLICSTKVYDNPKKSGGDAFVDASRRLFAIASATQASQAHLISEPLADLLGGRRATSVHPSSGPRDEADEIVEMALPRYCNMGKEPSVWRGPEMNAARKAFLQMGAFTIGDANGVSATLPFNKETALVMMSTTEPHMQLGKGLLIRLTLPLHTDLDCAASTTVDLNIRELAEQPFNAFFGGWCSSPALMPTFVAFYPNVLFARGYAASIAHQMGLRAKWAASVLGGPRTATRQPRRANSAPERATTEAPTGRRGDNGHPRERRPRQRRAS